MCVFCRSAATGQGEHALPRWLLKRWDGQAPITREVNRKPVTRANGSPLKRPNMDPVLLPVCRSCNDWLNRTFEQPARPHLRAVLDGPTPLDAIGTEQLARWWVKTLLLLRHPDAQDSFPGPWSGPKPWQLPKEMLPSIRTTNRIPHDLSLWVAVLDEKAGSAALETRLYVPLPRTFRTDGAGGQGRSTLFGTALPNGSQLLLQLVYHPLCDVEHPFEAAGLATKLWPDRPPTLDISTQPVLSSDGYVQLSNLFHGGVAVGLGPDERLRCPASSESLGPMFVYPGS
jgi:hypothetical protein